MNGYTVEMPDGGCFFTASKPYKSSLGALMEAFPDAEVLLFASSTLGNPSVGSYSRLVSGVEGYVWSFLRSGEYCSDPGRVTVVVFPGIGRFERDVVKSFIGWLGQFRVTAFLKTLDFILECKPSRVVLDLTHGINYMPTYTRLSVFDAITCYSAINRVEVRLLAYNSEPFPEGAGEASGLNIMLVEDHRFEPKWALSRLYDLLASSFTTWLKPAPVRSVFRCKPPQYSEDGWRRLYKCVEKLVRAASWGLIIPLAEAVEELPSIDLTSLKCELERFSYLRDCDDLVEIRGSSLTYLFSPVYEAALLLALGKVINSLGFRVQRVDGGFSEADLKGLADALLQKTPLELFKHEWSQLRDRVKLFKELGLDVGGWRRLKAYTEVSNVRFRGRSLLEFMREVEKEGGRDFGALTNELRCEVEKALAEGERVENPESRNFIAHAGLERNVTLVSARGESIYVKYDEKLRDRVDKIIKELT